MAYGDIDGADARLARIGNIVGLILAFVGLTTLLAWLLQPLAIDSADAHTTAPLAAATEPVLQQAAAEPAPRPAGAPGPRMAVLMIEFGADAAFGQDAIEKLPAAIGLAFLPDADASRPLARRAAVDGHESWIGIPMQPKAWPRVSPGSNTLLVTDAAAANAQRLNWALSRIDRPAGAYSMMGSAFTESRDAMAPVGDVLRARNIAFLDARSTPRSVAAESVATAGGAALRNDIFLDLKREPEAVRQSLARLASLARQRGGAVGLIQATPLNVALVSQWSHGLGDHDPALVPPSELAQ